MGTQTVTREIARNEWSEFFDGFSRRHDGWLVTIEVLDEELGDQIEAENQKLKGIVAEPRNDPTTIDIFVGESPDGGSTHIIDRPTRVRVEEVGGAEGALEIKSEDHGTTLVRFRSAAMPETVDGVLP